MQIILYIVTAGIVLNKVMAVSTAAPNQVTKGQRNYRACNDPERRTMQQQLSRDSFLPRQVRSV